MWLNEILDKENSISMKQISNKKKIRCDRKIQLVSVTSFFNISWILKLCMNIMHESADSALKQ